MSLMSRGLHQWPGLCLPLVMLCSCAPQHRAAPESAHAPSSEFVMRGEVTFWKTELLGEVKKSCAGCHENHVPFERFRLAKNYYDLEKSIKDCAVNRSGLSVAQATDLEMRSLRSYLLFHYVLDGVIHDENPEGIRRLGEGMALFLDGHYEQALVDIYRARSLVKAKQNLVQTFALEGCIQLFMMNDEAADRAFVEALRLEPTLRVDNYVFSPKITKALEATRGRVVQAAVLIQ